MIAYLINRISVRVTYKHIKKAVKDSGNKLLQDWLEQGRKPEMPKIKKKCGWIKHAFILWIRYLRIAKEEKKLGPKFYDKSIKEIIKGGGDTDTNACIVGGMIGAMIGLSNLPKEPKDKVLEWSYETHKGVKRKKFLSPKHYALSLTKIVYENAKKKLHIVGEDD
jgi:ADP-ribosyl-[dinitrogen reductase] hydrolase